MDKVLKKAEFGVCLIFVAFQLYTSYFGNLFGIAQKAVHLGLVIAIIFLGLCVKAAEKPHAKMRQALCIIVTLFGVAVAVYFSMVARSLAMDETVFTNFMLVFGIILIGLLLISSWQVVGPVMSIITAIFIFYAFFGKLFPALLSHGGMKLDRFVRLVAFTSEGIFGTPLTGSATFIATFIILGALFGITGVGDYMCELSNALLGSHRGGPAKVAVVSSALFGSISGSAVANVVGTGTFSIPMMKRLGYDSEFAGAVEATASTGGSIMPPIMGTAAFLMAEMIGVRYWDVVVAAIIPAVLYYLAVYLQVDLYAMRNNLPALKREELPPLGKTLRGIWKLSPMMLLIVLMCFTTFTVQRCGIIVFSYTLLLSCVSKETRPNKEKLAKFIRSAAKGCCTVAIATATAGIIIGVVTGTGLSYRLSSVLVILAGNRFAVLLILTMLASLIMGMGLPAAPCYLLLASLVAPAIVKMGASIMAAHLFCLYFGIISNVTPPVAVAAFAAAGLAECNPTRCGIKAFKLAIGGFLLPFFFVYNDVLLMNGAPIDIIVAVITSAIGIYGVACAMEGYIWKAPINLMGRITIAVGALLLVKPGTLTDVIGICILVAVHMVYNLVNKKKGAELAG